MKWSKLFRVLWIIIAALFGGASCSNKTPFTYEALEEEAAQTGDTKRLDKFEKYVIKGNAHIQLRHTCLTNGRYAWVCLGNERYNDKRPPETMDEIVRVYRNDRIICGCQTSESLNRQF